MTRYSRVLSSVGRTMPHREAHEVREDNTPLCLRHIEQPEDHLRTTIARARTRDVHAPTRVHAHVRMHTARGRRSAAYARR